MVGLPRESNISNAWTDFIRALFILFAPFRCRKKLVWLILVLCLFAEVPVAMYFSIAASLSVAL
jgi:hypothetical protein